MLLKLFKRFIIDMLLSSRQISNGNPANAMSRPTKGSTFYVLWQCSYEGIVCRGFLFYIVFPKCKLYVGLG